MDPKDYQSWLNYRGAGIAVDGQPGSATRAATITVFTNKNAAAVDDAYMQGLATDLGCSLNQIKAVAQVESGGSGYDTQGRPKILFERHKFHQFTGGKWSVTDYSNPQSGGYNEDSWTKLTEALCKDVDAAFKSASWGKFQVMGFWFPNLGFSSALEMAYSTVLSEANQYALFAGYIKMAGLTDELRKVSTKPDDCRPFAAGYNGSGYEQYDYHTKIANAMKALGG